jgi:hypothetical protein
MKEQEKEKRKQRRAIMREERRLADLQNEIIMNGLIKSLKHEFKTDLDVIDMGDVD